MECTSIHGQDESNFGNVPGFTPAPVLQASQNPQIFTQTQSSQRAYPSPPPSQSSAPSSPGFWPSDKEKVPNAEAGLDRLPTISAAAALLQVQTGTDQWCSTGLQSFDVGLSGNNQYGRGGIKRGVVTELWGAPGVGKSALGLELAVAALRRRECVVWADCAKQLAGPRLIRVATKEPTEWECQGERRLRRARGKQVMQPPVGTSELLAGFDHYTIPTVAHITAMLLAANMREMNFPDPGTSLMIFDDLDVLIDETYPQYEEEANPEDGSQDETSRLEAQQSYHDAVATLIAMLQKFAAKFNIAVVILTPVVEKDDLVEPAINTKSWIEGLATRIMLYRDFAEDRTTRFARVHKRNCVEYRGNRIGYHINDVGIEEGPPPEGDDEFDPLTSKPLKKWGAKRKSEDMSGERELPPFKEEDDEEDEEESEDEYFDPNGPPPARPRWLHADEAYTAAELVARIREIAQTKLPSQPQARSQPNSQPQPQLQPQPELEDGTDDDEVSVDGGMEATQHLAQGPRRPSFSPLSHSSPLTSAPCLPIPSARPLGISKTHISYPPPPPKQAQTAGRFESTSANCLLRISRLPIVGQKALERRAATFMEMHFPSDLEPSAEEKEYFAALKDEIETAKTPNLFRMVPPDDPWGFDIGRNRRASNPFYSHTQTRKLRSSDSVELLKARLQRASQEAVDRIRVLTGAMEGHENGGGISLAEGVAVRTLGSGERFSWELDSDDEALQGVDSEDEEPGMTWVSRGGSPTRTPNWTSRR